MPQLAKANPRNSRIPAHAAPAVGYRSRRALRRMLFKHARDRRAAAAARQAGVCTVGPGGFVLELAALDAAYFGPRRRPVRGKGFSRDHLCATLPATRAPAATPARPRRPPRRYASAQSPNSDWSGAASKGQKRSCTAVAGTRLEVGWISRFLLHRFLRERSEFLRDLGKTWVLKPPRPLQLRRLLATQHLWADFKAKLVAEVLRTAPRASARERASENRAKKTPHGTAVGKRVALLLAAEAAAAAKEERITSAEPRPGRDRPVARPPRSRATHRRRRTPRSRARNRRGGRRPRRRDIEDAGTSAKPSSRRPRRPRGARRSAPWPRGPGTSRSGA